MKFTEVSVSLALLFLITACGSQSQVVTTKEGQNKIQKKEEKVVYEDKKEMTETKISEPVTTTKTYIDIYKEYIDLYNGIAKEEMRKYGIPASITLAQGLVESGAGKSDLAVKANNHFGIKCHKEWQGEKVYHEDDKRDDCFRKYDYAQSSFEDHSVFLKERAHYRFLFSLPQDDYVSWAKGLREAGYAVDKKYPDKLISMIENYELYKYDAEVLNEKTQQIDTRETPVKGITPQPEEETYVVKQGDNLYAISKKYGLTLKELMDMNNLSNDNIHIGQILKVRYPN